MRCRTQLLSGCTASLRFHALPLVQRFVPAAWLHTRDRMHQPLEPPEGRTHLVHLQLNLCPRLCRLQPMWRHPTRVNMYIVQGSSNVQHRWQMQYWLAAWHAQGQRSTEAASAPKGTLLAAILIQHVIPDAADNAVVALQA